MQTETTRKVGATINGVTVNGCEVKVTTLNFEMGGLQFNLTIQKDDGLIRITANKGDAPKFDELVCWSEIKEVAPGHIVVRWIAEDACSPETSEFINGELCVPGEAGQQATAS